MSAPSASPALPPLRAMLTWLQGQPAGRIIGARFNATGCALHTWLVTRVEGPVDVDEETIVLRTANGMVTRVPTPADYREVIQRLDNLGGLPFTVTVREVREVLRDVLAEYGEGVEGFAWERKAR